jgi:hypothetical protein
MSYEKAAKYDIIIDKGSTWQRTLTIKDSDGIPVDLTDYYAELDIRITEFSEETAIQLDSNSSSIVLGGTSGTISLIIEPTDTSAFTIPAGKHDLKLVSPLGISEFILYGNVRINQTVTR